MDIGHAQAGDDASFIRDGVVGSGKREVDDGREAIFFNGAKLRRGGLAGGAKLVADGAKIIDSG